MTITVPVEKGETMADFRWLYSETENPTFRICMKCGCAYRNHENDGPFHHCPNCGELLEVE